MNLTKVMKKLQVLKEKTIGDLNFLETSKEHLKESLEETRVGESY